MRELDEIVTRPVDELPPQHKGGKRPSLWGQAWRDLPEGQAIWRKGNPSFIRGNLERGFPDRKVHQRKDGDGVWFWWTPKESKEVT